MSSCAGFAGSPCGNGPTLGVQRPSKTALGISVTGSIGWTSHSIAAVPSPWELCIKGGRQHCHREQGAIWPLVGAPGERWCLVWERETGQCPYEVTYFFLFTCKQGLFPRSNEDRADADFTLDRCYMSLCSSVYFLWANQMVNTFYIAKKDELL